MNNQYDFEGLARELLRYSREFVPSWLPGGKMRGREYVTSGIKGGNGDSLSVNVDTGKWADFSGDLKGGDLTSLFAAVEGLSQGEAAKRLARDLNFELIKREEPKPEPKPESKPEPVKPEPIKPEPIMAQPQITEHILIQPPLDVPAPTMDTNHFGAATRKHCYRNAKGEPLFYIARYDPPDGKKQFITWSWSSIKLWVMKAWPEPRPLYGLDKLAESPEKPVMVVEGEKACESARTLAGPYVVVTWPGGAKALDKVDLGPLEGRKLLLWPDADEPGVQAMDRAASILHWKCPEIKILDTKGQPKGWDAADAVDGGWQWDQFVAWAKPRARVYGEVKQVEEVKEAQVITPAAPPPDESERDDSIPASLYKAWDEIGIATTRTGQAICNVDNALRVIEGWKDFNDIAWYDEFHKKILTRWRSESIHEWRDIDDLNLTQFMQRNLGLRRMSDDMVHKAVKMYAHDRIRNEPKDWISGLAWDGKNRIDTFLSDCLGAEDGHYTRAASRNFWVGMIARIFRPGCKLDNMMILEGGQGKFKSTALSIIGGKWYTEAQGASVTSKDFFMILNGKLLVEIGEMSAFNKSETAAVKQVVTCQTDRYRTPYGRTAEDHPRMSIFVGTTNDIEYLRDNTGARRFWPIKTGLIDKDKIAQDRTQLYAEALARFNRGEKWYEMPPEATVIEQERRRIVDEWEQPIDDYLHGKDQVTTSEVAAYLKIDISHLGMQESRRIANVMRILKWDRKAIRNGSRTLKIWAPNEPKTADLPMDAIEPEEAPF